MGIGTFKMLLEENDPVRFRDEYYYHELDLFKGDDEYNIGILDELQNLKKLIDLIGASVTKEEKEYTEIREQFGDDIVMPGDEVTQAFHKTTYRPFAYKAMFMLIHSVFETGVISLRKIMLTANRLNVANPRDTLKATLEDLTPLEGITQSQSLRLSMFQFIRNKITHADGYFTVNVSDPVFSELENFVIDREDIRLHNKKHGTFTHRIIVRQSGLFKEYIDLVTEVFNALIKAAYESKYIDNCNLPG